MSKRRGGRESFERQLLGLLGELYGAALRLTRNREDAEDLVAEVVAKAWAHRRLLRDRAKFRPWIFRILTNQFLTNCRRQADQPVLEGFAGESSSDEPEFSLFNKLHQPFLLWWSNPEREFLNNLLREDIERAVDALPDAFRVVIVLADLEGLSYREIARILKVPIGTVRSRLARGRSLLQKALWRYGEDAGLIQAGQTPAGTHR